MARRPAAQDYLFGADYAAIYFLEKNGYDVSYISGVDTDRLGADYLIGHKAYISVGHDEYWSGQQRFNVEEARDAGVNLLFWSGNEVYWKTRLEASTVTIDGSPTDYRTLVCYKETWANRDPIRGSRGLRQYRSGQRLDGHVARHALRRRRRSRAATTSPAALASMPLSGSEAELQLHHRCRPGEFADRPIIRSRRHGTIRCGARRSRAPWRACACGATPRSRRPASSIAPGILGYEWNTSPEDEYRPDGLIELSETVDVPWSSILIDQGNLVQPGVATHNLSLYRAESGALVFGAGTVFWSWGLSDQHDTSPYGARSRTSALKQFTINMFADMGIQPGVADAILTSQGLVRATQSTDHIAPTTTISVLGPTEVTEGQIVTITGTATDNDGNPLTDDGQVAAIEVSTDNGVTWHPVTGTTNWTYSWQAQGPGNHTIKARAVDDSVNLQTSNIQSVELSVMAEPEFASVL